MPPAHCTAWQTYEAPTLLRMRPSMVRRFSAAMADPILSTHTRRAASLGADTSKSRFSDRILNANPAPESWVV